MITFYFEKFKYGGIEKVFIDMTKNLNKQVKLVIFNYDEVDDIFNKIPSNVEIIIPKNKKIDVINNLLKKIRIKLVQKHLKIFKYFLQIRYIKKKLKMSKENININFYDSLLTLFVVSIFRGKKISWVHNSPDYILKKNKILKKYFYKKMDKIICICNEQKEDLNKVLKLKDEKLGVIYNPLDKNEVDRKKEEMIEETIEIKNQYFIKIGRLDLSQKDYLTLIKAYEELYFKKNLKYKLLILGDGPDRELIANEIKKRHLENNIILKGNVENPYPWLKNAKLQIHSSFYEGLPTVLLEGIQCDQLIISSKCKTGVLEILDNGRGGFLYEVGDYKKIVEIILEILENPQKKVEKIEYAKKRMERFYPENIVLKINEFLEAENV